MLKNTNKLPECIFAVFVFVFLHFLVHFNLIFSRFFGIYSLWHGGGRELWGQTMIPLDHAHGSSQEAQVTVTLESPSWRGVIETKSRNVKIYDYIVHVSIPALVQEDYHREVTHNYRKSRFSSSGIKNGREPSTLSAVTSQPQVYLAGVTVLCKTDLKIIRTIPYLQDAHCKFLS